MDFENTDERKPLLEEEEEEDDEEAFRVKSGTTGAPATEEVKEAVSGDLLRCSSSSRYKSLTSHRTLHGGKSIRVVLFDICRRRCEFLLLGLEDRFLVFGHLG